MELEQSQEAGGPHHKLAALVGEWEGRATTWFDPADGVVDESAVRATIRPVLNGTFVLHEYEGSFGDDPRFGMALIGFNLGSGKFECAWADTFHTSTSILFSEGGNAEGPIDTLAHYPAPEGPPWGWRTEVVLQTQYRLVVTAYNVLPTGEEAKAVETVYNRVG